VCLCVCVSQICDFGLARLRDLNNTMTANVGTVQVRLYAVLYCTLLDYVILGWSGVEWSGVEWSGMEWGGVYCRKDCKIVE
jgi:hypothetical protein